MAKYQFHRLGSSAFQEMVQALLEVKRRNHGELIQFGSAGPDGAREATWTQAPNHPDYEILPGIEKDTQHFWVFQVKYHDIGLRGWANAAAAVISDLRSELDKLTTKYSTTCHHYVLITNVPLTGASRIGTRDKVSQIAESWKAKIASVKVWDASDLSRMLDNNPGVRTAYNELILPGDVIGSLYHALNLAEDRRRNTLRGYLRYLLDHESRARADEAGDDDALPLSRVFIDQTMKLDRTNIPECYKDVVDSWSGDASLISDAPGIMPDNLENVPSSFPLLWGDLEKIMILAGPGYGKSTVTQFLTLYHAARIIDESLANALAKRITLPPGWTSSHLDSACTLRIPFRIELRRYAKWRKSQAEHQPRGIAAYISRQLIGGVVESDLSHEDIFTLISKNATLLVLDGLDEVPNKDDRDDLLKDCEAFLYRCSGEDVNLQVIMSSRPQGYHGEFDRFQPLRWALNDLRATDFQVYAAAWLDERIRNPEERTEAEERIKSGMASDAVRRLATTLLQATVMLTIVRKRCDIPEERNQLFLRYVDVVFQREKSKNDLISKFERELRLLHEVVGYKIHESVARGESGVMPEATFKDLVWCVWRLVRGDQDFRGIPNQEIQRIYDLTTDRLVFLSGKGTNQSDVDFLIQPYREYFAANYMSNHSSASTDAVFPRLVERGAYWLQVLRFYGAMAKPAEQSLWALKASARIEGDNFLDTLVQQIQTRRAVLFSLPEFSRFQFIQLKNTVSGCLPEAQWWAWLGQKWIAPIIRCLGHGEVWKCLWRAFVAIEQPSLGTRLFAIQLFPELMSAGSSEYLELVAFMEQAVQAPELAKEAITAALAHRIPVRLELAGQQAVISAVEDFPYRQSWAHSWHSLEWLSLLPKSIAEHLICTLPFGLIRRAEQWDPWTFMELPVRFQESVAVDLDRGEASFMVIARPPWMNVVVEDSAIFLSEGQGAPLGPYRAYLQAVFCALVCPNDSALHLAARTAMEALPEPPTWGLTCDHVLGPPPALFNSDAQWIAYKSGLKVFYDDPAAVRELQATLESFCTQNARVKNAWTVLLFPVDHWDYLSDEGLLCIEEIALLRDTQWARLQALSNGHIEFIVTTPEVYSCVRQRLPVTEVFKVAVRIHKDSRLMDSLILSDVMSILDFESIDPGDMNEILKSIPDPGNLSSSWASTLINVCLRVAGVDLQLIAKFWGDLNAESKRLFWFHYEVTSDLSTTHDVIRKLLELENVAALDLAARMNSLSPCSPDDVSSAISVRAATMLLNGELSEEQRSVALNALHHGRPTLLEAQLLADENAFRQLFGPDGLNAGSVAARINVMPQLLPKSEFVLLRQFLGRIVCSEHVYLPQIRAAALEAIIQIDVARCSHLTEADWQTIE